MKIKNKLTFLIVVFLILAPCLIAGHETEIPIAFSINLLSPNDDVARNQFSILVQENLPKIGIGVRIHESTTWENIAKRTWSYPYMDYDHIPTYENGGYDALFWSLSSNLCWDPLGYYSSYHLGINRNNIYQYVNPLIAEIELGYFTEHNITKWTEFAHWYQAVLYEDLPAISIIYPKSLYAFKEILSGIDWFLLSLSKFRAEKWDDPADHIIKYPIPETLESPSIFSKIWKYDKKWMAAVYGSLFQRSQISHEWEPIIATNYSLSSDGRNYTINLDLNAKFSDGSPVFAEDVKYTYDLHFNPEIKSDYYFNLRSKFDSNNSIEIIDSNTLNFNFSFPYAFSMDLLSLGIIDKSSVEPAISVYGYSIFDEVPLSGNVQDVLVKSCGPFMLDNYTTTNVKLVQNPYWNNLNSSNGLQPKLTDLYFNYYEDKTEAINDLYAGTIDIFDPGFGYISLFFDLEGITGVLVNNLENRELALNMKHPVFGTGELTPNGTPAAAKAVRKAINHAIPRQIIVDQIYEGRAAPGVTPMPDGCIGFDESLEPYAYDLDLADDYMEDAGFEEFVTWFLEPTSGFTITFMLFVLIGLAYIIFTGRR
ncbi:MAG: hypothetical protein H7644_09070 [Candidatus Heimdallarchaeota archaeon]|nr:hypothetical protein [Candidatus Heimdallarchaeota archaeon]MCK5143904.1 hypothetical protein [Candidatus Heimdallarchaeota archaeon]